MNGFDMKCRGWPQLLEFRMEAMKKQKLQLL